jgi:hypothetical protein
MKQKSLNHSGSPVIEVTKTGSVIELRPEVSLVSASYPTKPGVYQWRPIARTYSASAEHGSWSPVYGWGIGVLENEEMPTLMELPSLGLEPV